MAEFGELDLGVGVGEAHKNTDTPMTTSTTTTTTTTSSTTPSTTTGTSASTSSSDTKLSPPATPFTSSIPPLNPEDLDNPVLHVLYTPTGTLPKLQKHLYKVIEVRIPAEELTLHNKEVQLSRLWGTDYYTDDSDVVAVLRHTGRYLIKHQVPHCIGVLAYFRVLPSLVAPAESNNNHINNIPYYHATTDGSSTGTGTDAADVNTNTTAATATTTNDTDTVIKTESQVATPPSTSTSAIASSSKHAAPSAAMSSIQGYLGTKRYNYRSRHWHASYDKTTLELLKVTTIDSGSITQNFKKSAKEKEKEKAADTTISTSASTPSSTPNIPFRLVKMLLPADTRISRTLHGTSGTGSISSGSSKKRRHLHNVRLLNTHSDNSPILKYVLGLVGDRGLQENEWMTSRLRRESYYFEAYNMKPTDAEKSKLIQRYELSLDTLNTKQAATAASSGSTGNRNNIGNKDATYFDRYKFVEIDTDTPFKRRKAESTVPATKEYSHVVADNLDIDEIEWGDNFVKIRGSTYFPITFTSKALTV